MAAEPKRIQVDHDTRLEPILEEASTHPIIVDMNGTTYRLNAERVSSSPFTVESAYASARTIDGRAGADISTEDFDQMMRDAREDYADYLADKMSKE